MLRSVLALAAFFWALTVSPSVAGPVAQSSGASTPYITQSMFDAVKPGDSYSEIAARWRDTGKYDGLVQSADGELERYIFRQADGSQITLWFRRQGRLHSKSADGLKSTAPPPPPEPVPAPPSYTGRGIRLLTGDTLKEALAWDASKELHRNSLHILKMSKAGSTQALSRLGESPFSVVVLSPFRRVANAAVEARRKFEDPPTFDLREVNDAGLQLAVSAGTDFGTADSVENVIVKRGDAIHRPTSKTVTPTTITNRMGATRESAVGTFVFPLELFRPEGGPLVLVVIGKSGNVEIPLSSEELAELR